MRSFDSASRKIPSFRIRFHVSLLTLITGILVLASAATLLAVLSISRGIGAEHAEQLFQEAGHRVEERLDAQLTGALHLADQLSTLPGLTQAPVGDGASYPAAAFMFETLAVYTDLYSLYTGFPDGRFFQVIRTSGNPLILSAHDAPGDAAVIVRSIAPSPAEAPGAASAGGVVAAEASGGPGYGADDHGGERPEARSEHWTFLNAALHPVAERILENPSYDPRTRPWFTAAAGHPDGAVLTLPYLFNSLRQPGITAARRGADGVVVGVDITLDGLHDFLGQLDVSPGTGLILLDEQGSVLAANPAMEVLLGAEVRVMESVERAGSRAAAILTAVSDLPETGELLHLDAESGYLSWVREWSVTEDRLFRVIAAAPLSDFVEPFVLMQSRILLVSVLLMLLVLPLVFLGSRSHSRFLEALAKDAERVRHFDFKYPTPKNRVILEFEELSRAFVLMKQTVEARTRALAVERDKLQRIVELGIAMSAEQNTERLLELILEGAKEISHADGGSLYLKARNDTLDFKIVLNDSLGFAQGGTSGAPISMPPVPLFSADGNPNLHNVVTCAYHTGRTIAIEDAYADPVFDFSGTVRFDELNGYRSRSFLTVPLKVHDGDIIGALQLINSIDPDTGTVVPFDKGIQGFVEALSAESAAILVNRTLVDGHTLLFDSLIRLIAGAIDIKSPYTGGHCKRVPEIAQMLADEAEDAQTGPFADFVFGTDEERRAFHIGAWLHDCGKMTTPDYVMDKAVKLETLNNRIHEIRTRFEVLLRDARIRELEAVASGADPARATAEREREERELYDEFAFVAECNHGTEEMDASKVERLRLIGERTWFRHLDRALGLSWEEHRRFLDSGGDPAPGIERLLDDRRDHRIPYAAEKRTNYDGYGFTLAPPEWLYNRGELYNLAIPSGTLTPEERFKINEHILQTIVMLDMLPFSEALSNVPRYAATHHENLTGNGYPRRLSSADLTVPERIMVIADKFEALTASDRPYKQPKRLSEAVEILYQFKARGEIDADLFDLFLESGIYRRYADRYLRRDQLDEVDVSRYLGPVDPGHLDGTGGSGVPDDPGNPGDLDVTGGSGKP